MFVNFSFVKNFHRKIFFLKCHLPPQINHRRIHTEALKYVAVYSRNPLATPFKYYKYLLLRKSKIKNFEILRRNLNTSSKLFNKKNGDKETKSFEQVMRNFILSTTPVFMVLIYGLLFSNRPEISWEEFKKEILSKGEAKELIIYLKDKAVGVKLHEGAAVKSKKATKHYDFIIRVLDINAFEEKLRKTEEALGIPVTDRLLVNYKEELPLYKDNVQTVLTFLTVLYLAGIVMYFAKHFNSFPKMDFQTMYELVDPLMGGGKGVKFSDVAGLKEAKTEIMDFVDYLKRPEVYRSLGAKVPKGALLLGPPGCGKTLLAKAVATEANVPFLSMNGSEFIEIIGGLGASRVRELFWDAKKRLPCIIYIDEIDAIGKKRESMDYGGSEAEQTLNQLLVEMDGVVSNEGIILLASTNRADVLDKALLRPGRFDRHILIDLPTFQERQEIFEHHLRSIHLENKPETYSKRLAHLTPGFSGADIANVCNEAALHAARLQKKIVQGDDLEYAVERVVGGTEKRSSSRTPEERKMFAYYEAGKALVGWISKYGEALLKITIVARTDTPAGWTHFSPGEKFLYSVDDLRGKMCMGLGGRVAITLLFNRVTNAGQKDLDKVTKLAYAQVRRFGMSETIGLMSFDINDNQNTLKKPYSKVLGNLFDQEARRLVTEAYREAEKLLLENKDKLIKLAEELLVKETLNYDDVVKLIGPPSFEGKKLIESLEFAQSLDQAVGPEPEVIVDGKNP